MAKSQQDMHAVLQNAAGSLSYAGQTFESLRALFQAIAELSQSNATVSGLANLGAGMAEDLLAHSHCAADDISELSAEVRHG